MKLITEVDLPEYPFRLDHRAPVVMMGSCFTENIGKKLERYLFPACINPFGVTYNPLSVKKNLEALMEREEYVQEDLRLYNDQWFSFDHHTGFSSPERKETLDQINHSFRTAKKELAKAGILILSWGTSWVYRYQETGQVVCNCHKIPAKEFTRTKLSTMEIIKAYEELLPKLYRFNSGLKVLYTVSPIRHWKDGAHGNQLSKASLLLAGNSLQEKFPGQFSYFPSYEIVMDELRDYRFYAEDMLHTSEQTTDYIWEKFRKVLISKSSEEMIRDLEPFLKLIEHKPLNKSAEAYRKLEIQKKEKLENLRVKYPELALNKFLD